MKYSILQTNKLFTIAVFILTILSLGSCSSSKQIGSVKSPNFEQYNERSKRNFSLFDRADKKTNLRKEKQKSYVRSNENQRTIDSFSKLKSLSIKQYEQKPTQNTLSNTMSKSGVAFIDNIQDVAFIDNIQDEEEDKKTKKTRLKNRIQKKFERQLYRFVPKLDLESIGFIGETEPDKTNIPEDETEQIVDKGATIALDFAILTLISLLLIPLFMNTPGLLVVVSLIGVLSTLAVVIGHKSRQRIKASKQKLGGLKMTKWATKLAFIPFLAFVSLLSAILIIIILALILLAFGGGF